MVDGKLGTKRSPDFAGQTIDATEREFVAEPRAVAVVVRVAGRAVLAGVRQRGIREGDRHAPELDFA